MRIIYLVLICFFLIWFLPFQIFAGPTDNTGSYTKEQVHGVKQDCLICHMSHNMKEMMLLKGPISELCLKCHLERKTPTEHVVDVFPSMNVEVLPLTDGKMTCVTCHDSHKYPYENMLRVNPIELCQMCHRY